MAFKVGAVFRITNRVVEIIHDSDIFSKPVSSGAGLQMVGLLNSYVAIPLFNTHHAIGIIFEQFEPDKEREILFTPKNDCIISKLRLVGTYNPSTGKFKKGIDFHPTLDSEVFTVDESHLEAIYSSTIKKDEPSLLLGNDIFYQDVGIHCDPNILFGKHCAVFGNTGSGKSCTVTSILQGVYGNSDRLKNVAESKLKTIIIDSNNEYSSIFNGFDEKPGKPDWVQTMDYTDLELSHKDLSFYELTELLKEDSPNVLPYLELAVSVLKGGKDVDASIYYEFSLLEQEVLNQVPKTEKNGKLVEDIFTLGFLKHVVRRINNYSTDSRLGAIFGKQENSIEAFLEDDNKRVLVLNLHVSNDVLSLLTYMICKSIFNYKTTHKNKKKNNVLLVLEEAHRYISAVSTDQINNFYIEKLAREGRKFGVNLMVSTQRPSEVSNTVISQCNSLIVHKITNSSDLEFIKRTIEYEDKNQIDLLTSLKQQQALVLGEAFAFSSLIRIADASPLPDSQTPSIFKSSKALEKEKGKEITK